MCDVWMWQPAFQVVSSCTPGAPMVAIKLWQSGTGLAVAVLDVLLGCASYRHCITCLHQYIMTAGARSCWFWCHQLRPQSGCTAFIWTSTALQ